MEQNIYDFQTIESLGTTRRLSQSSEAGTLRHGRAFLPNMVPDLTNALLEE